MTGKMFQIFKREVSEGSGFSVEAVFKCNDLHHLSHSCIVCAVEFLVKHRINFVIQV